MEDRLQHIALALGYKYSYESGGVLYFYNEYPPVTRRTAIYLEPQYIECSYVDKPAETVP